MKVGVRTNVALEVEHPKGNRLLPPERRWTPAASPRHRVLMVLPLLIAFAFGATACNDDETTNTIEGAIVLDDHGCEAETFDDDNDPSTPCVFWTDCLPGEFVDLDGTTAEDRECLACDIGEFSITENADECMVWTNCPAGQYVTNLPSATEDRICDACEAGTFSTAPNAPFCTP